MLLDEQWDGPFENTRVIGIIHVCFDHLRQERRLRAVHIIQTRTIGDETNRLDQVQEVLDDVLRDFGEAAAGSQEPQQDPVRVPVVCFPESAACNHESVVERDETAHAAGTVSGPNVLSGQIRPYVDDLLSELLDDSVIGIIQENRVCRQLIRGNCSKLRACLAKVCGQEIVQFCIVA